MDGLYWKIPFKWMIWGYHHFRKPPYNPCIYIYPTHTTRLDVANMCCWATCCNVGHQRISTESPTQSAELQTPAWPTCAVIKQACFQTILEMAKSIRFYALDITGVFKFFSFFLTCFARLGWFTSVDRYLWEGFRLTHHPYWIVNHWAKYLVPK